MRMARVIAAGPFAESPGATSALPSTNSASATEVADTPAARRIATARSATVRAAETRSNSSSASVSPTSGIPAKRRFGRACVASGYRRWCATSLLAQPRPYDGDVPPVTIAARIPPISGGQPPRVLVVDDDRGLHEDYDRCLAPAARESPALRLARDALFGAAPLATGVEVRFRLAHAYAGESALELVEASIECADRYSVAFVDMRMPPGWSGVETIRRIWRIDPSLLVVLCTAYSDFTWDRVVAGVGRSDGLHLLRKPFDTQQVRRFAEVLAKKWQLAWSHSPANRFRSSSR